MDSETNRREIPVDTRDFKTGEIISRVPVGDEDATILALSHLFRVVKDLYHLYPSMVNFKDAKRLFKCLAESKSTGLTLNIDLRTPLISNRSLVFKVYPSEQLQLTRIFQYPEAHSILFVRKERYCYGCGHQVRRTKICGGCNLAPYCSSDCQKVHWSTHKPICHMWKAYLKSPLSELD